MLESKSISKHAASGGVKGLTSSLSLFKLRSNMTCSQLPEMSLADFLVESHM